MITIHRASVGDLPAIRALLAAAGLPTDDVDPALVEGLQVAREGNLPLRGVVGLQHVGGAGTALLRSLAVATDARSQGLGARLLAAAEAQACATRIGSLYLLTTSAAPFFASHGYEPRPRLDAPAEIRATAQFAGLCPASSVLMVKHLVQQ